MLHLRDQDELFASYVHEETYAGAICHNCLYLHKLRCICERKPYFIQSRIFGQDYYRVAVLICDGRNLLRYWLIFIEQLRSPLKRKLRPKDAQLVDPGFECFEISVYTVLNCLFIFANYFNDARNPSCDLGAYFSFDYRSG